MYNDKAKKELDKIKEIEKTVDREELVYKTNEYTYSFQNFQTIKTFSKNIYGGSFKLKEADKYQTDLLVEIMNFKKKTKPKSPGKKQEKEIVLENLYNFFEGRENFLMLLQIKYFQ